MSDEYDWDHIPDPQDIPPDTVPDEPPDPTLVETQPSTVEEKDASNICPVCGEPIFRKPGTRGRLPKYHPHCRPSKVATASTRGTKQVQNENEVALAVAAVRKKLMQGVWLLSMVNQFDAFCIAIAVPDICDNLAGVCERYPRFRKELIGVEGKGSIFGLVISVITVILPILANHKLIPSKFITKIMLQLPAVLHKMHQNLEQGPERMADIMFEKLTAKMQEHSEKITEARLQQDGIA